APALPAQPARDLDDRCGSRRALRPVGRPRTVGQAAPARPRAELALRPLGALGQRLVPPDRTARLRLALEPPRLLPAVPTAERATRAPARRAHGAGRRARVTRRSLWRRGPARPVGRRHARPNDRPPRRPLPRGLPDDALPRRGVQRVALPAALDRRVR